MNTPKPSRSGLYSAVAVSFLLLSAGGYFVIQGNQAQPIISSSSPSPTSSSSGPGSYQVTKSGGTFNLQAFMQSFESYTPTYCALITLSSETVYLPSNPEGYPVLQVQDGNLQVCPNQTGGFTVDFNGQATSAQEVITGFSFSVPNLNNFLEGEGQGNRTATMTITTLRTANGTKTLTTTSQVYDIQSTTLTSTQTATSVVTVTTTSTSVLTQTSTSTVLFTSTVISTVTSTQTVPSIALTSNSSSIVHGTGHARITVALSNGASGVVVAFSSNVGSFSASTCITASGSCYVDFSSGAVGTASISGDSAGFVSGSVSVAVT